LAQKIKVFIDTFYYQATLSGIRTYINELALGAKNSKNNNIKYHFSHDISNWGQNHKFLNPKNRLLRLYFHMYYFLWKQIILPFHQTYTPTLNCLLGWVDRAVLSDPMPVVKICLTQVYSQAPNLQCPPKMDIQVKKLNATPQLP